ncbi:MAG TPA: DNA repair protein RecN, partial [Thermoanaerobaculia bacterium]
VCVTHLPQIASFGTTHFHVWKEDVRGQTRAQIRRLENEEERVTELARMLAGETIPASAIAHARELLGAFSKKPERAATPAATAKSRR